MKNRYLTSSNFIFAPSLLYHLIQYDMCKSLCKNIINTFKLFSYFPEWCVLTSYLLTSTSFINIIKHCMHLKYLTRYVLGTSISKTSLIHFSPTCPPIILLLTKAGTGCVLWKKLFFQLSQNAQDNTYARVSFVIKLQTRVL